MEPAGLLTIRFIFLALAGVKLDFGAVSRHWKIVQLEQFLLGQEDDGLVDNLELRLDFAYLGLPGHPLADGPVKEPTEVEIMFLDSVFSHLGLDAQIADEGIDAIVVEVVELRILALGGEMVAESVPTFHRTGRPLVDDALLLYELVEGV